MFYLENMCCLCLKSSASLSDLFSMDHDGLPNFEKIDSSLSRLVDAIEDDDDLFICNQCSDIVDMIYRFNNICLRNIKRFFSYRSILKQNKEKARSNLIIKMTKDGEEIKSETSSENDESFNSDSDETKSSSGYIALADLDDSDEVPICDSDIDEAGSKEPKQDKVFSSTDGEQPNEGERSNNPDQLLIRNTQISKDKKNTCFICSKTFAQKHNLLRHLNIHTGEKPYACEICRKSFSQKGNLDNHMFIHSGEKSHRCNICKKAFNQKSNLNTHKLIHSDKKPFSCDKCNKSFRTKHEFVVHKRIHTGEKPFSCTVCNKVFSHTSHLILHKRTHTGEKPYSCDICTKSFSCKPNLTRHKKIHKD